MFRRPVMFIGAALVLILVVLAVWFLGRNRTAIPSGTALTRSAVAAAAVQSNYNPQTGLFCPRSSNCWWWTANDLTALADYGRLAHTRAYLSDLATTYTLAPYQGPDKSRVGAFLDTWNDDDGWWGLAWLAAYRYAKPYDAAQATGYLQMSEHIFTYMAGQWNTATCGGGLWQNQNPGHLKDAIANELFLSLGAGLYQSTGNRTYLDWAVREWAWFRGAGFIGSNHLVFDHLNGCTPSGSQYWTYNQGVILGGLAKLYQVSRSSDPSAARTYLQQAETIANCVTQKGCGGNPAVAHPVLMDARGILSEPCETSPCTYAPAYAFKGIFVRNLGELNAVTGRYTAYLQRNAQSLWQHDRSGNLFGFYWDSPPAFYLPRGGEAPVEGAALDLLVAQIPRP